jgi:predicted secreted protein
MGIATGIAIYFLIWWIVLFAVLPWGVLAQGDDAPPGSDPGAPQAARIWLRLVWTTLTSTVVFAILAFVYLKGWVSLDDLARLIGMPEFPQ